MGGNYGGGVDRSTYWTNYLKWHEDARVQGTHDVAETRAELAASGLRPGDEQYDITIAAAEQAKADAIADIEQGYAATETRNFVTKGWGELLNAYSTEDREGHRGEPTVYELAMGIAQPSFDEEQNGSLKHDVGGGAWFDEVANRLPAEEQQSRLESLFAAQGMDYAALRPASDFESREAYAQYVHTSYKDTYGAYSSLQNTLGRDPEMWEWQAAILYEKYSNDTTEEVIQQEAMQEALDAAYGRPTTNKRRGQDMSEVSPGLNTADPVTSKSPWI